VSVPNNLLYTKDHEWISLEGDVATVGITQYAADALGDVVFVALPTLGDTVSVGTIVGGSGIHQVGWRDLCTGGG